MPNIKSAKKRVIVSDKKSAQNKSSVSEIKTALKKLNAVIATGDKAQAQACYNETVKILDSAVSKGHMHINTAANKKSGFAKKINALA